MSRQRDGGPECIDATRPAVGGARPGPAVYLGRVSAADQEPAPRASPSVASRSCTGASLGDATALAAAVSQ